MYLITAELGFLNLNDKQLTCGGILFFCKPKRSIMLFAIVKKGSTNGVPLKFFPHSLVQHHIIVKFALLEPFYNIFGFLDPRGPVLISFAFESEGKVKT